MKKIILAMVVILQCVGCEIYSSQLIGDQCDLGPPAPVDLSCNIPKPSAPKNIISSSIIKKMAQKCIDRLGDYSIEISPFSKQDQSGQCESDYSLGITPSSSTDLINRKFIKIDLSYKSKHLLYFYSQFGIYVDIINLGISTNKANYVLGTIGGYDISRIKGIRDLTVTYKLPSPALGEILTGIYIDINSIYERTSGFVFPDVFHLDSDSTKITINSVQIVDEI